MKNCGERGGAPLRPAAHAESPRVILSGGGRTKSDGLDPKNLAGQLRTVPIASWCPARSSTHEYYLRFSYEKLCLLSASPLPKKILRLFLGALMFGVEARHERVARSSAVEP